MTTVYDIIKDAYRQSNLIALGVEPNQLQESEALRYLSRIVKSVFGNEMGENFESFPLGSQGVNAPQGYPWYGNTPGGDFFIPLNKRLICNLTADTVVYLHPNPEDGSRVGVIDVSKNFVTNSLTLQGNGRQIEGGFSLTLNTNSTDTEWFYRADLGNWQKVSPLAKFDTFPFPEEFDDMFILLLAFRLNPAYERDLDPQSGEILKRSRGQFRSRYHNIIPQMSEIGLIRNSRMTADRDIYSRYYGYYDPQYLFNFGVPW